MFTRHCRPDRARRHGGYVILDYKTGSVRTEKQVRTGLAPQLTLEAAMLRQGGFNGTSRAAARSLSWPMWRSKAARRAGEFMPIDFKDGTPDAQADRALKSSPNWCGASTTITSPIARWCIRCGKRATATTTIWRA